MREIPTRHGAAGFGTVFAVSTRTHSHARAHTPHKCEISLLSNCGPRERETARFQRRRVRARWLSAWIRSCLLNPNVSSLFAGCLLCGPHLRKSPPRTPPGPRILHAAPVGPGETHWWGGGARAAPSISDVALCRRRCQTFQVLTTNNTLLRPKLLPTFRCTCARPLCTPDDTPAVNELLYSPFVISRPFLLRTRNALGTFILE